MPALESSITTWECKVTAMERKTITVVQEEWLWVIVQLTKTLSLLCRWALDLNRTGDEYVTGLSEVEPLSLLEVALSLFALRPLHWFRKRALDSGRA